MLNVIMLNVIILSVVMLSVVAPVSELEAPTRENFCRQGSFLDALSVEG
jgi:hypothetical protein